VPGSERQFALSYDGDACARTAPGLLIGALVAGAARVTFHTRRELLVPGATMWGVSTKPSAAARVVRQSRWTLITNHGTVLLDLAEHPGDRLSDIAERVGISRRAVQMIISDLVEAGYVERQRVGRRNRYVVDSSRPLRHPSLTHQARVRHLLGLVNGAAGG
jgi:DNA-binding transcriptional ArsR family regulator